MTRVIVTTCGREMRRIMKPFDALRQQNMRNALIGCGTNDDDGAYVEIADVRFERENLRNYEPMSRSATVMPLRLPNQ